MFRKLSVLIKNKNKSYIIIKKSIIIAFIIFILLFVLLLLSMYGPGINYISLERSDLISVLSNLISGYLGLIGSFIGILVTYLIFHEETVLEETNKEEEENKKKQYALDMLSNLLLHTIIENNTYWELLARKAVISLVSRCDGKFGLTECLDIIKGIDYEDICKIAGPIYKDFLEFGDVFDDIDKFERRDEIKGKFKFEEIELMDKYMESLRDSSNIIMENMVKDNKFIDLRIKENLIYDKNWIEYLYYIDSHYRYYVIKWITYLENNSTYNIDLFDEILICREKVLDLQIYLGNSDCEKYKIINIMKKFEMKIYKYY